MAEALRRRSATRKGKQLDAFDEYERTVFTDREINNQGAHNDRAHLHAQARQAIGRLAGAVGISLKLLVDLPNRRQNLLAVSFGGSPKLDAANVSGNHS